MDVKCYTCGRYLFTETKDEDGYTEKTNDFEDYVYIRPDVYVCDSCYQKQLTSGSRQTLRRPEQGKL